MPAALMLVDNQFLFPGQHGFNRFQIQTVLRRCLLGTERDFRQSEPGRIAFRAARNSTEPARDGRSGFAARDCGARVRGAAGHARLEAGAVFPALRAGSLLPIVTPW